MVDPNKPLPACLQCSEPVELADNITLGVKWVEEDGEMVAKDIGVFHSSCWEHFRRESDLPAA